MEKKKAGATVRETNTGHDGVRWDEARCVMIV